MDGGVGVVDGWRSGRVGGVGGVGGVDGWEVGWVGGGVVEWMGYQPVCCEAVCPHKSVPL